MSLKHVNNIGSDCFTCTVVIYLIVILVIYPMQEFMVGLMFSILESYKYCSY